MCPKPGDLLSFALGAVGPPRKPPYRQMFDQLAKARSKAEKRLAHIGLQQEALRNVRKELKYATSKPQGRKLLCGHWVPTEAKGCQHCQDLRSLAIAEEALLMACRHVPGSDPDELADDLRVRALAVLKARDPNYDRE